MKVFIYQTESNPQIHKLQNSINIYKFPLWNLSTFEYLFFTLYENNFKEIYFILSDFIFETRNHYGDGSKYGIKLNYFPEKDFPDFQRCLFRASEVKDEFYLFLPGNMVFGNSFFSEIKELESNPEKNCVFFQEPLFPSPFFIRRNLVNLYYKKKLKDLESISLSVSEFSISKVNNFFKINDLKDLWELQVSVNSRFPDLKNPGLKSFGKEIYQSFDIRLGNNITYQPISVIGKSSILEGNNLIGPNAFIGENCIIGSGTNIQNSVIENFTFIGEDIDISDSFVIGNKIFNYKTNQLTYITEEYLLSRSNELQNDLSPFLSFPVTTFLLIFLFIPFALIRFISLVFPQFIEYRKKTIFILTNSFDLDGNREKLELVFSSLNVSYLPIQYYNLFLKIFTTDLKLVGNSFSEDSNQKLNFPSGIFNLFTAFSDNSHSDEEIKYSEIYYSKFRTWILDLKIIFKNLLKVVNQK